MSKSILMLVGDYAEDYETMVPFQALQMVGHSVHAVCALLIPGGRAPEYLRTNAEVIKIVQYFAREKKPIAAVCHAAQLLAAADVIRGKRVSAYPACAAEVRLAGAEYAEIAVDQAVTDGVLVTAPAWPAHAAWLAQFLTVLGTRISL